MSDSYYREDYWEEEGASRRGRKKTCEESSHKKVHLKVQSSLSKAVKTCRARILVGMTIYLMCFCLIAFRLTTTMLFGEHEKNASSNAASGSVNLERAEVVDRTGRVIATSLSVASAYANPKLINEPKYVAKQVAKVVSGVNEAELYGRLTSDSRFVWIKRNMTPKEQYNVNALGIPGISFIEEQRRVYPYGNMFSHSLGFVNTDNKGLGGIEKSMEQRLLSYKEKNKKLELSLDVRVQGILRDELLKSIHEFSAIGATGIIANAKTGEIIAMSSLPDFDPHNPGKASELERFNRASLGVYEMGSTFKAITTAMALDSGKVSINQIFDATNPIRYARFSISDSHPKARPLNVPEIFMYSSNIGTAKMALEVGAEKQKEFIKKLGLLDPINVGLPEISQPLYPKNWSDLSVMTVSFGHGIAVSPLHLVQAVSTLLNGGVMKPLTLVKDENANKEAERVISEETSYRMRQLMRLVVEKGTGSKGDVEGYLVGGKTGTAEKASASGYNKKALMSSFVASFPIHDPEYVILVMLDEPKGTKQTHGYATGGWTAAPTVSRVIARIGPVLGVKPVRDYHPAPENDNEKDLKLANFKAQD